MTTVLAVAPRISSLPALASDEELARIGDVPGVELRTLTQVTLQRIIDRLSRERFDALLWIGHGAAGRLAVDGRETVDPQWLASQLSNYGVGLAIIAACESGQRPDAGPHLVQSFADVLPASGIDVVSMATRMSDRGAMAYDVALLQALASGSPLRQAHLVGVTAAAAYDEGPAPQLTPRDGAAARPVKEQRVDAAHDYRLNNSERMLAQMDGKMDRMGEQLNDHSTRLRLLEDQVQALRDELRRLSTRLDGINTPVGYSRTVLAGGALAMTVMILLLLFLTWRLL